MLISLTHKFIFVANLKTASTAIEHDLKKFGQIVISKPAHGKHNGLLTIATDFAWIKKRIPFQQFFVFGVIRDPVDYLVSLYNAHHREVFDGTKLSTKGHTFEQYYHATDFHPWHRKLQSQRLSPRGGALALSHLVRFEDLDRDFQAICKILDLPVERLTPRNSSPKVISRADVSAEIVASIQQAYAEDYDLIANGPRDPRVAELAMA